MARKKEAQPAVASPSKPRLVPIEKLFEKHQVPPHEQRGVMVRERWAAGKAVTDAQFVAAVAAFRRSR